MKKLILLAAYAILLAACDNIDPHTKADIDNSLYLPSPGDNTSRLTCRKMVEQTRISSRSVTCDGSIYTCGAVIMVRCANGDTYFNLTDILLPDVKFFTHDQLGR